MADSLDRLTIEWQNVARARNNCSLSISPVLVSDVDQVFGAGGRRAIYIETGYSFGLMAWLIALRDRRWTCRPHSRYRYLFSPSTYGACQCSQLNYSC